MSSVDYIMEDKLIKKAIETTTNKCENDLKSALHEILVQDWLYNELCDELKKINSEYPCRIREEYSLYRKKDENIHVPNPHDYCNTYPKYLEHERTFTFKGKAGTYDLAILDETRNKILYAIEVKKIDAYNTSSIHRGYEDIYVLSDLLKMQNKDAKGYILIVAWYNSKPKARRTKLNMQKYLDKVHKAYDNAEVYCQSVILDEGKI